MIAEVSRERLTLPPVFVLGTHITIILTTLLAPGAFSPHIMQFCDVSWVPYNLTQF